MGKHRKRPPRGSRRPGSPQGSGLLDFGEGPDGSLPLPRAITPPAGSDGAGIRATGAAGAVATLDPPIGWDGASAEIALPKSRPAPERVPLGDPIRREEFRTRRWLKVLVIFLGVVPVVLVGFGVGAYLYAQRVWESVPQPKGLKALAPVEEGKPTTVLVVGSDTREDLSAAGKKQYDLKRAGGGQRSDTIMLVHVDPKSRKAFVLSLPRDLRVQIPGQGTDKINAAYNYGAQKVVETVQAYTGVPVNHYVEVNFESFKRVVDALGGVDICVRAAAKDRFTGLNIPAGCTHADGNVALSYARARHYRESVEGRWVSEGDGDFGRIRRQQELIQKILAQIGGVGSVSKVNQYVKIARENLKIDQGFDFDTAIALYRRLTPMTPDRVEFLSFPAYATMRDGISFVEPKEPEASQLLARLRGEAAGQPSPGAAATPSVAPGDVRVRVLNGTGKSGLAATVSDALRERGLQVTGVATAPQRNKAATQVVYGPNAQAKADLVRSVLGYGVTAPGNPSGSDVEVVLGTDVPAGADG